MRRWKDQRDARYYAARFLIAATGNPPPNRLTKADIFTTLQKINAKPYTPSTRHNRTAGFKRILRQLWEDHGAPKLHHYIPRPQQPKPRNVTATKAEREAILTAAPPHLKAWLLLCSDLAIRSGTAAKVSPAQYNSERRELRFRTKFDTAQTLPVTDALASLFASANDDPIMPLAQQLHPYRHSQSTGTLRKQFRDLKQSLGIHRKITPHDLRRTTAVSAFDACGDLRVIQALLGHRHLSTTLHYLDHDTAHVEANLLEAAKLNARKENQ